jgi:hypothetical protein
LYRYSTKAEMLREEQRIAAEELRVRRREEERLRVAREAEAAAARKAAAAEELVEAAKVGSCCKLLVQVESSWPIAWKRPVSTLAPMK